MENGATPKYIPLGESISTGDQMNILNTEQKQPHTSVMTKEVVEYLQIRDGGIYIDGTIGAGGHTEAILQASNNSAFIIGIDKDPEALNLTELLLRPYRKNITLRQGSFADMESICKTVGVERVDGILLDLGISSMQLESSGRGFSFIRNEPLDMRMDPQTKTTAADIVNKYSVDELEHILRNFGDEPKARRISKIISEARPISNTKQLAELVSRAVLLNMSTKQKVKIHPATKTFQALRIAVNTELKDLEMGLLSSLNLLKLPNLNRKNSYGRLAVIAFHSLEDRIVKTFIKTESTDCLCSKKQPICTCDHAARLRPVNRKPLVPSSREILSNPRSRSAKLRVAEVLDRQVHNV